MSRQESQTKRQPTGGKRRWTRACRPAGQAAGSIPAGHRGPAARPRPGRTFAWRRPSAGRGQSHLAADVAAGDSELQAATLPFDPVQVDQVLDEMGIDEAGLAAFDQQLAHSPDGAFCHGNQPGMADCVLIPQIFNAQRFNVPLDGLTRVQRVADACMALDAFRLTQPSACPDAEG